MNGTIKTDRRDVVLSIIREKEDQLHALAVSLVIRLAPKGDESDLIAYNLATLLQEMMGEAAMRNAVEAVLFAPNLGAGRAA